MKLYQKSSTGKTKFLNISTDGAVLTTEWGILGGKTQKTEKVCQPMNKGKANELSAAEQAKAEMKSKITLKMKEGYTKEKPDDSGVHSSDGGDIDLDKIPSNFCPNKPISECPASVSDSHETLAQRKHDGHCVFLVKGRKTSHVYSRRMEDLTEQCIVLPFVQVQLEKLSPGDFVLTEVTFEDRKLGKEIPRFVAQVIRNADPKESLARYTALSKTGNFACHPFDILFYKNAFMGDKDYTERHKTISGMGLTDIPKILPWEGPDSALLKRARAQGWEGFVLRRGGPGHSRYGYTMDGKAHRAGSYKFKFTKTGDFVVDEALYGISGKHSHFFSKFHIIDYGFGSAGEAVPIDRGYVGPGTLSHEQLEELTNELKSGKRKIPFVVEVEYQSVHDDTGKLQFGIIQRIRDDKAPGECIAED